MISHVILEPWKEVCERCSYQLLWLRCIQETCHFKKRPRQLPQLVNGDLFHRVQLPVRQTASILSVPLRNLVFPSFVKAPRRV